MVILYRLYLWTGNLYAHNCSVQRVDGSERTFVIYIQKVSYRIGFFIDNDYKSATKLHNLNEIFLRRWEKNENYLLLLVPNADLPRINHEHGAVSALSVVVSRESELA